MDAKEEDMRTCGVTHFYIDSSVLSCLFRYGSDFLAVVECLQYSLCYFRQNCMCIQKRMPSDVDSAALSVSEFEVVTTSDYEPAMDKALDRNDQSIESMHHTATTTN